MDRKKLENIVRGIASGEVSEEDALKLLSKLPFADLGHAKVDHHRALRQGAAEVIFAEGKTIKDVLSIVAEMVGHVDEVLVSRADHEKARALLEKFRGARQNERARTVRVPGKGSFEPRDRRGPACDSENPVVILSGGTADAPVVEEASETLSWLDIGHHVISDVGVAGIHRLFAHVDIVEKASVLIVVAGMEGALASVAGGMFSMPVVGVPVSVGYGAGAGGIASLLGMLNSCASGVTVMNIDNGFGAACAAGRIHRLLERQ